jgi:NADH dehydrogenase FAD-containing subunit
MFIPFDMAGHDHLCVVNAGVGDAGLSAIEGLQRHSPDAEILLIDRRAAHPKVGRHSDTNRRLG